MARYTFTLTLGDLTLTLAPISEAFQRSIVTESQVRLEGFTPNGNPRFTGPAITAYSRRYEWVANVEISEEQALIIETMLREQSPENFIVLKDEYEYLEPEVAPSKSFVAGSTITIGTTRTTGFFEGNVYMEIPDSHKQNIGANVCTPTIDQRYKSLSFTLKEIP